MALFDDGIEWRPTRTKVYDVRECAAAHPCEILLETWHIGQDNGVQHSEIYYSGTFGITLLNTAWTFVPEAKQDSTPSAGSNGSGKTVSLSVSYQNAPYFWGDPDLYPKGKVKFELSLPLNVVGYRPGYSSNMGNETASEPDYVFEPNSNPTFAVSSQMAITGNEVDGATVLVTSQDFGGVGILRAQMQIGGEWFYADHSPAVDENDQPVGDASCAVNTNDKRGFAQLPIDVDCNWIADSWEKPFVLAEGLLERDEDSEASTPAPIVGYIRGDGFGAYDEYRGFHTLDSAGQKVHQRTDPRRLDTFYSDFTTDGTLAIAVRSLIAARLQPTVLTFHQVAADQFTYTGLDSRDLNINSDDQREEKRNFVNILADGTGNSQYCGTSALGGTIDGKHNTPIRICISAIASLSALHNIDSATMLAVITAHEYGHRVGLDHYIRAHNYVGAPVGQSQTSSIADGQYADASLDRSWLYLHLQYFAQPSGTGGNPIPNFLDKIIWNFGGLLGIAPATYPGTSTPVGPTPAINPTASQSGQRVQGLALNFANTRLDQPTLPPSLASQYSQPVSTWLYHPRYLMSYTFFAPDFDPVLTNYVFAPSGFIDNYPGDVAFIQPNLKKN